MQEGKSAARDIAGKLGEREIKYLETNCKRMMYGTFKKEGNFIGSGVIEAGCKTVVGKRTKQSGLFWQAKGAQNILNIRCAILGTLATSFGNTGTIPKRTVWRRRRHPHFSTALSSMTNLGLYFR